MKVGDIVWRMHGRKKDADSPTLWFPVPTCVEHVDEHKFLDGWGCGGSLNSIGKNWFLTREECLRDFEARKADKYLPEPPPPPKTLGDVIPDGKRVIGEDTIVLVFVGTDYKRMPDRMIPWEVDRYGEDTYRSVTLGRIRDKAKEIFRTDFVTVVVEDAMSGEIYQAGNYDERYRLHGRTQGYW